MIRKTISKAFGRPSRQDTQKPLVTRRVEETVSPRGIHVVFRDLRDAFHAAVEKRFLSEDGDPSLRVSTIRQELEGQEFVVEVRASIYRVRNTMNGLIWLLRDVVSETRVGPVSERRDGSEKRLERLGTLSLHPDETGTVRLIEKPFGKGRTPFEFTSIPQVVTGILGEGTRQSTTTASGETSGVAVPEPASATAPPSAPES